MAREDVSSGGVRALCPQLPCLDVTRRSVIGPHKGGRSSVAALRSQRAWLR